MLFNKNLEYMVCLKNKKNDMLLTKHIAVKEGTRSTK